MLISGVTSKNLEKLEERVNNLLYKAKHSSQNILPKIEIEYMELSEDIANQSKYISKFLTKAETSKKQWQEHKKRAEKLANNVKNEWKSIRRGNKTQ